jgi:hypothetical protein
MSVVQIHLLRPLTIFGTYMSNWDQIKNGGKGSARRSGANDDAYAEGWARIFGKRDELKDESQDTETKEEVPPEGDNLQ